MKRTTTRCKVLVVDGSRVVRATLSKHLTGEFDVMEESNGESAWQTLMLDAAIGVVISGAHPPKLDALDLLGRLRASSIRRLREMPLLLIVSDIDDHAEREKDRANGIAGFLTKSMKKESIVASLNTLLSPSSAMPEHVVVSQRAKPEPDVRATSETTPTVDQSVEPERFMRNERFRAVLSSLTFSENKAENVAALVFAIDHREALVAQFGPEMAGQISQRFANLLLSKISNIDLIGRCRGERMAIISYGVDVKQAIHFGQRVCKSLAAGQISIRGRKVRLTASVGVASTSDDGVRTGRDLFFLADQRLDQALVCGGNNVSSEHKPDCPLYGGCSKNISRLLEVLNTQPEGDLRVAIAQLGEEMLPLILAISKELRLDLPVAEIRRRLASRAEQETVDV